MRVSIYKNPDEVLDAKVDIEPEHIILHSRGGAKNQPSGRNSDYSDALRIILERLRSGGVAASGVWLDSRVAKLKPLADRRLVDVADFERPLDELITMIRRAATRWGQAKGTTGGNSTKQVLIGVPGKSVIELQAILGAPENSDSSARLPTETLRRVTFEMIDEAVANLEAGAAHAFGSSKDYDVLTPSGHRLPPKAVFGLALEKIIGRPAKPSDFSAGWGQPCFDVIEEAGYPIVEKREEHSSADPEFDDEETWTEGDQKLTQHKRRERKPSRVRLKKRRFIADHGHLFCERCGLVPTPALGPFGDACIEVHHATVTLAEMDGKRAIRLRDLQCLCANCHRIVHREMAAKSPHAPASIAPTCP